MSNDNIMKIFQDVYDGKLSTKDAFNEINLNETIDHFDIAIEQIFKNFPLEYSDDDLKRNLNDVTSTVIKKVANLSDIKLNAKLSDLGLDSLMATKAGVSFNKLFNLNLNPTFLFEASNINELVDKLLLSNKSEIVNAFLSKNAHKQSLDQIKDNEKPDEKTMSDDFDSLWEKAYVATVEPDKAIYSESVFHYFDDTYEIISSGAGDNVILFGGLGSKFEAFREIFFSLSKNCHVHYISLPYHGKTQTASDIKTFEQLCLALSEVINYYLNGQSYHLLGYSLGGSIAQIIFGMNSDKVMKVQLISCPAYYQSSKNIFQKLKSHDKDVPLESMGDNSFYSNLNGLEFYNNLFLNNDVIAGLHFPNVPVQLIVGENDPIVTAEQIHFLETIFPRLEKCIINGAGHFLLLNEPESHIQRIVQYYQE